jgi:hypothetical protein
VATVKIVGFDRIVTQLQETGRATASIWNHDSTDLAFALLRAAAREIGLGPSDCHLEVVDGWATIVVLDHKPEVKRP